VDSVEDRIIAPLLAALQRRGMEEEAGSDDARAAKEVSGILREGRKELLQGTNLAELLATALRKDAAATVESEGGAQRGPAMTPVADESRRLLSSALAAGQEAADALATAEIGGLLAKDAVRPPSRPQDGAGCGLTRLRRSGLWPEMAEAERLSGSGAGRRWARALGHSRGTRGAGGSPPCLRPLRTDGTLTRESIAEAEARPLDPLSPYPRAAAAAARRPRCGAQAPGGRRRYQDGAGPPLQAMTRRHSVL
jgi:hypothetical protein